MVSGQPQRPFLGAVNPRKASMSSLSRWAALTVLPLASIAAAVLPAGEASAASTSATSSKAQALVTAAIAATNAAKSVTVSGSGSSSGKSVKIALTVGPSDAFGSLTYSGQTTTLRRLGSDIYAKGTKGFLEQQGLSTSQATVEANKWFRIPTSDATDYHDLDQFLTVTGLLSGLVPSATGAVISGTKKATLNGQAVEVISGTFSGQKGQIYVASHGKPFLLKVVQNVGTGGGGTINLTNYDKSVHTTKPKGAVTE
jgi:hypothetical protein